MIGRNYSSRYTCRVRGSLAAVTATGADLSEYDLVGNEVTAARECFGQIGGDGRREMYGGETGIYEGYICRKNAVLSPVFHENGGSVDMQEYICRKNCL